MPYTSLKNLVGSQVRSHKFLILVYGIKSRTVNNKLMCQLIYIRCTSVKRSVCTVKYRCILEI